MNLSEYKSIENLNYFEYCNYLNNKYKDKSKSGLFKHHYYEYRKANLSNNEVAKQSTEEERNTIIYCNFLEHLFLHILIGEQTDSRLALGLGGAINYIIPQINKYLDFGAMGYSPKYYENIDRDVFQLLCERCNQCTNDTKIALEHNNQLYLEVEQTLKDKGKALVVLGTGLGKTTTALQYLWNNKCRALVIGPNKLIKSGWEEYPDWVDTTTYQSFANRYLNIDYSNYGLVILDEAHHAGFDEKVGRGAEVWSKGIKYLIDNNVVKVLGLTATPNRSDKVDIGNTLFEDCVCEGYAIEDGIEKGLVYPFDYITALYNTEEIVEEYKDCDNRELVGQLDLALQQSLKLKDIFYKYMPTDAKRKGIIFIQDIKDEQYVKDIMLECYPNIEYRAIHSKMNKKEVDKNREWFENTDEGYLLAVNMISEGAHYKGVNTLIMFRKTSSYLVYTQQLGRIITLTKNENPNAIVFDLVNNIDSIEYNNRDNEDKRYQVSRIVRALEKSPLQKSRQVIIADESRDIVNAIRDIKDYKWKRWEDWEIETIIRYYPIEGRKIADRIPNHSIEECCAKARYLNIYYVDWTDNEIAILRENKEITSLSIWKDLLPRKSWEAIKNKSKELNLNITIRDNLWQEDDLIFIKDNYEKGIDFLYDYFKGKRTKGSIKNHLSALGLTIKKKWSEQELNILKNYYKENLNSNNRIDIEPLLKLLPNRNKTQIINMASFLKIGKIRDKWKEEELDILKQFYKTEGTKIVNKIPNKSRSQILQMAHKLNLSCDNSNNWTEKELEILKENYSKMGKNIIELLPNKKWPRIREKASQLKISAYDREILCVELNQIFKNNREAAKCLNLYNINKDAHNVISQCCRGKLKSFSSYHWKYIEEGDENKDD